MCDKRKYNIVFECEKGQQVLNECSRPLSQQYLDQTYKLLEEAGVGKVKKIIITFLDAQREIQPFSLDTPIMDLPMSFRTTAKIHGIILFNTPELEGVPSLRDLLSISEHDLRTYRGVGKKMCEEINNFFEQYGYQWEQESVKETGLKETDP